MDALNPLLQARLKVRILREALPCRLPPAPRGTSVTNVNSKAEVEDYYLPDWIEDETDITDQALSVSDTADLIV